MLFNGCRFIDPVKSLEWPLLNPLPPGPVPTNR